MQRRFEEKYMELLAIKMVVRAKVTIRGHLAMVTSKVKAKVNFINRDKAFKTLMVRQVVQ